MKVGAIPDTLVEDVSSSYHFEGLRLTRDRGKRVNRARSDYLLQPLRECSYSFRRSLSREPSNCRVLDLRCRKLRRTTPCLHVRCRSLVMAALRGRYHSPTIEVRRRYNIKTATSELRAAVNNDAIAPHSHGHSETLKALKFGKPHS